MHCSHFNCIYVPERGSGLFKDVSKVTDYRILQTDEEVVMALSSSTNSVYNVFEYFVCGARPSVERFDGDFRMEEDEVKYL